MGSDCYYYIGSWFRHCGERQMGISKRLALLSARAGCHQVARKGEKRGFLVMTKEVADNLVFRHG